MGYSNRFNPAFRSEQHFKSGRQKVAARVKEHPVFRFRGALASRAKRVKPSLPKLPEAKP